MCENIVTNPGRCFIYTVQCRNQEFCLRTATIRTDSIFCVAEGAVVNAKHHGTEQGSFDQPHKSPAKFRVNGSATERV